MGAECRLMGTNEGQVSTFVDTWVSALMSLIEDSA